MQLRDWSRREFHNPSYGPAPGLTALAHEPTIRDLMTYVALTLPVRQQLAPPMLGGLSR